MNPTLYALGAIALWSTLATLGLALAHVPPFLLTGLSLLIGSLIALPLSRFDVRQWRVPVGTLALGVYGLFGFHFLLFMALRYAPPVEANLVNYLWPLLMVVLAPAHPLPRVTVVRPAALPSPVAGPGVMYRRWALLSFGPAIHCGASGCNHFAPAPLVYLLWYRACWRCCATQRSSRLWI